MKGFFFRKTIALFIAVLLVATMAMLAAYSYFGRSAYIKLETDRLVPVAISAQNLYERSGQVLINQAVFADVLSVITDTSDVSYYYFYYVPFGQQLLTNTEIETTAAVARAQQQILLGHSVELPNLTLANGTKAIGYGVPMWNLFGEIDGGIIIVKEIPHIQALFSRLNAVLWLMFLCVIPLFVLFGVFSMHRLARPLRDMTGVAIAVSEGNYQCRANESYSGEMGIFARALNRMSEALARTINELNDEKNRLWYILSSFSEGVAAIDNAGNLTHYNQSLMKMFGTVDIKTPLDLVPDKTVWEAFDAVLDTKEPQALHAELPGQRVLWISIVPVLGDAGLCTGAVGLFKDATEMEQLERMRRDYVANVSHELRTPLTAVRGLLEPLADGMVKNEEDRQRYYAIMLRETERLSRLITDLLQLSRLQSGSEGMEVRQFNLQEILEDLFQSYESQAEKNNLSLTLLTHKLPPVMSDSDRIEQLLIILLDNALRYTNAGGEVLIETGEDAQEVTVTISNTGPGIAPEDLPYIFDRFFKADRSRKEGGTGLGLSIAHEIVEQLGERLEVESEPNVRTAFTFSVRKYIANALPLRPAEGMKKPKDIVL
ncbi:MAG: ATP-binding protein [Clostridiales bacterium]|nr:ATP-binding protein [Clostridiales bacterium]